MDISTKFQFSLSFKSPTIYLVNCFWPITANQWFWLIQMSSLAHISGFKSSGLNRKKLKKKTLRIKKYYSSDLSY